MGRTTVRLTLVNDTDLILAEAGLKSASEVRRVEVEGIVDAKAALAVLPESVAARLGLPVTGEASGRAADRRTVKRPIVDRLRIEIGGRSGHFRAVVDPNRAEPVIGFIVLNVLDLLVDPRSGSLGPRDPERIEYEI